MFIYFVKNSKQNRNQIDFYEIVFLAKNFPI